MDRYDRQRRVRPDGAAIDDRLAALRVLLVGAGGIGAPLAIALVRAGVGSLTIVDPDVVSNSDLARQPLYYDEDVDVGLPKADAALRELRRIGGRTRLAARPIGLTPRNASELVPAADLVLDATDHLPARRWIEEACREVGRPWIHTAAIEGEYRVIPFLTPGPPCFRCYLPEEPPVESLGTCETRGVIPVATSLAAHHAVACVWRWLAGEHEHEPGTRPILRGSVARTAPVVSRLRPDPRCPVCSGGEARGSGHPLRLLCGRRRVEGWTRLDGPETTRRLAARAESWRVEVDGAVLRARRGGETLTLFPEEGRLVYGPIDDLERARTRLAELLGEDALP